MNRIGKFQRIFLSQKSVGNISWLLHRLSGVALALYLVPHFFSIHSSRQGAERFDQVLHVYTAPFFKWVEFLLVMTVTFHLFNGLRIIAMDCFNLADHQKLLFGVAMAGCAVVLIAASLFFVPQILAPVN